jgi:uncharacterized membrane protein (Fun14 family)
MVPIVGLLLTDRSLAQGDPVAVPPSSTGDASPGELFSDAFFLRIGFSFIVGLAVGYALKIAFKVALVGGGIILVSIFALQFAGLVDVNWSGMESHYDGWTDWLSVRGGALLDFMADHLSNAAGFLAGLALGLRL